MKRLAEKYLEEWSQKGDRKPLVIRGARQVGKSTLVRNFAKNRGLELFELNIERERLASMNDENLIIQNLIEEIEYRFKKSIGKNTLIFFDEIQSDPRLILMLRYFYEERPDILVVAAGSLLEIVLKRDEISFPVGRVEFYYLAPMSFSEFLMAIEEEGLAENILTGKVKSFMHNELIKYLKLYFYIGGMPKAILVYLDTKSLHSVRLCQEEILETYRNDFPKYAKRIDYARIDRVFINSTLQLGQKVNYQNLDRDSKAREIKKCIELLVDAMILLPAYHAECSGLPVRATVDESVYKLYFLDIGMLNAVTKLDWEVLQKDFEGNFITKGLLAEQFIAQHLNGFYGKHIRPELFYWLRDRSKEKAEVDFVIQHSGQIIPIEVKSDQGARLKSLLYFAREKKCSRAVLFNSSFSSKNIIETLLKNKTEAHKVKVEIESFPLYLIESLPFLFTA